MGVRPVTQWSLVKIHCGHLMLCYALTQCTLSILSISPPSSLQLKLSTINKLGVKLRMTGVSSWGVGDTHLLSTLETGYKHRSYAPSWLGEGLHLTIVNQRLSSYWCKSANYHLRILKKYMWHKFTHVHCSFEFKTSTFLVQYNYI